MLMHDKESANRLIQAKTLVEPQTGTILTVQAYKSEKGKNSSHVSGTPQTHTSQIPVSELRKFPYISTCPPSLQKISEFSRSGQQSHVVNFTGAKYQNQPSLYHNPTPANLASNSRTSERSSMVRKLPQKLLRDRETHEHLDSQNLGGRTHRLFQRTPNLDHSGENLRFNHLVSLPPTF